LADLAGDELEDRSVDLELAQVDRRQAVLLRDELGQPLVIDITKTRERRDEPLAGALGFVLRLLKLLKREHLLANQQLSNTAHASVPQKDMGFRQSSVRWRHSSNKRAKGSDRHVRVESFSAVDVRKVADSRDADEFDAGH